MNENKAEEKKQGFLNRWTIDYNLKGMQLVFIIKKMDSRYWLNTNLSYFFIFVKMHRWVRLVKHWSLKDVVLRPGAPASTESLLEMHSQALLKIKTQNPEATPSNPSLTSNADDSKDKTTELENSFGSLVKNKYVLETHYFAL